MGKEQSNAKEGRNGFIFVITQHLDSRPQKLATDRSKPWKQSREMWGHSLCHDKSWLAKGCDTKSHPLFPCVHQLSHRAIQIAGFVNGVYSLKWRLTERYPRWGTLADPRPGRAAADQCKSSEFLQELRISGFPRFGVSPTCFRAK